MDKNINSDIVNDIDRVIDILDTLTSNEVSRIKLNAVDTEQGDLSDENNVAPGGYKKEYHHGRCDVGSPWAKGAAFDILE